MNVKYINMHRVDQAVLSNQSFLNHTTWAMSSFSKQWHAMVQGGGRWILVKTVLFFNLFFIFSFACLAPVLLSCSGSIADITISSSFQFTFKCNFIFNLHGRVQHIYYFVKKTYLSLYYFWNDGQMQNISILLLSTARSIYLSIHPTRHAFMWSHKPHIQATSIGKTANLNITKCFQNLCNYPQNLGKYCCPWNLLKMIHWQNKENTYLLIYNK